MAETLFGVWETRRRRSNSDIETFEQGKVVELLDRPEVATTQAVIKLYGKVQSSSGVHEHTSKNFKFSGLSDLAPRGLQTLLQIRRKGQIIIMTLVVLILSALAIHSSHLIKYTLLKQVQQASATSSRR